MSSSEPPIQPLSVPAPWVVSYNELRAIEPNTLTPDAELWYWFAEDLVELKHPSRTLVDVGWYPHDSSTGRFRLYVIRNRDWRNPSEIWESRALAELLARIDETCTRLNLELGPLLKAAEAVDDL